MKPLKVLSSVVITGMLTCFLAACGNSNTDKASSTKKDGTDKITIGMSFPAADHGWMGAVIQNAKDEAKKLGVDMVVSQADNPNKQTNDVEDLITKKVDAIVLLPIETDSMTPVAKEVKDANIPLFVFDRELNNKDYTGLVKGDNSGIGKNAADFIGEELNGKGKVAIISSDPSSVNSLRVGGFEDEIKSKYPNLKVVANQSGSFQKEKAYQVMQNVLQANSKIDAVYTIDDEMAIGVLQAIKEAKRNDIKIVTGAGGFKDFYQAIKDSSDLELATFTYSPLMIKTAVDQAVDKAKGKAPEKQDTVLPAEKVTKDNVDKYLNPNANY